MTNDAPESGRHPKRVRSAALGHSMSRPVLAEVMGTSVVRHGHGYGLDLAGGFTQLPVLGAHFAIGNPHDTS